MAYIHCHNCDWSQDDFYSRGYNPLTKIIDDIKWLWKPRRIKFDAMFIEIDAPQLMEITGVNVSFKDNRCFSWSWLLLEIVKDVQLGFKQKWWTYKSWKNSKYKWVCPQCKTKNLDID